MSMDHLYNKLLCQELRQCSEMGRNVLIKRKTKGDCALAAPPLTLDQLSVLTVVDMNFKVMLYLLTGLVYL